MYCARFGARTATVELNLHRAANVGSRTERCRVSCSLVDRLQTPMATIKRVCLLGGARGGSGAQAFRPRAIISRSYFNL